MDYSNICDQRLILQAPICELFKSGFQFAVCCIEGHGNITTGVVERVLTDLGTATRRREGGAGKRSEQKKIHWLESREEGGAGG